MVLLGTYTGLLSAQAPDKKIVSITDFLRMISQDNGTERLRIHDLDVKPDPETDQAYITDTRDETGVWDSLLQHLDTIRIKSDLELYNIHFRARIVLPLLHFEKMVHFENISVVNDLIFKACVFKAIFQNFNISAYHLRFDHCRFEKGFYWEKIETVMFEFVQNKVADFFQVFNTDVPLNVQMRDNEFNCTAVMIYSDKGGELNIFNTRFLQPSVSAYIFLGGSGYFDFLNLSNNHFQGNFLLTNCSVKERLSIIKCQFDGFTAMQGLNAPEKNTNARWYQMANEKLAIATQAKIIFNGKTSVNKDLEDEFYNLIKIYYQFLRSYKYNGDEESYNACFIEMKDLLTKKSYWDWSQEGGFDHFAEWQLNRFLRAFCNYGVNPGKALFLSIFYIAIFGFLYLIFPPEKLPFEWSELGKKILGGQTNMSQRLKLLRVFLRQWLKACAYSMNAFVTLGYGKLPGHGFARYIAVAEGLLGWFLFAVFSASLIGQILQQS